MYSLISWSNPGTLLCFSDIIAFLICSPVKGLFISVVSYCAGTWSSHMCTDGPRAHQVMESRHICFLEININRPSNYFGERPTLDYHAKMIKWGEHRGNDQAFLANFVDATHLYSMRWWWYTTCTQGVFKLLGAHHPHPCHLRTQTLVFADSIMDPIMDAWRHTLHIQTQIRTLTQTRICTKGDIA